jgi:hypothetical protein
MFRPVPSQMLLLEKEVHTQICLSDYRGVLDGEIANTRQDQVLKRLDTNDAGPGVDEEDVRVLERDLAGSSPKSELPIVPALLSWCASRCSCRSLTFSLLPWVLGAEEEGLPSWTLDGLGMVVNMGSLVVCKIPGCRQRP